MRKQFVLFIVVVLALQSSCRRKKHGHSRKTQNEDGNKRGQIESKSRLRLHKKWRKGRTLTEGAEKRSRYSEAFLDQYEPHSKSETGQYEQGLINNYATENTPIFWKDVEEDKGFKKEEEDMPPVGFQQEQDELPSTVGPNENIYGGFPINDVLGGFELPSPETLTILKQVLKQHGPRNEYEAKVHHDLENWAYGYEHHALPEYDIKETPPFYVAMLEGLKMMEKNKKKPGCNADKAGCGPMVQLTDDQCNTLAGNCPPSKPITSDAFEKPCPWKIIQMLYGCKKPSKPKAPAVAGKPDGIEPAPPKPDSPEEPKLEKPKAQKPDKPEEAKPEKPEEAKPVKPAEPAPEKALQKEEQDKKPKPIPIEFPKEPEGKLAPDIKEDDKTEETDPSQPNAKLETQLGFLGMLQKQGNAIQEPQSRTGLVETAANTSTTDNKAAEQSTDISIEVDRGQTPAVMESELTTKAKTKPAPPPLKTGNKTSGQINKNVLDLSVLPMPQEVEVGTLKGRLLELVYPNKQKLFVNLPSMKDLPQKTALQRSIPVKGHIKRKHVRYKIAQTGIPIKVGRLHKDTNLSVVKNATSSPTIRNETINKPANTNASNNTSSNSTVRIGDQDKAIITTEDVTFEDIRPVITSLGRELESRLTSKLGKSNDGDTKFTISVGISPEDIISRKNDVTKSSMAGRNQTSNTRVNMRHNPPNG